MFQFHTGAIKSSLPGNPLGLMQKQFQFHTGAIKSWEGARSFRPIGVSFNSILVRLKGFMKATYILYATLMGRVKSIFTLADFMMVLLSTYGSAKLLGG